MIKNRTRKTVISKRHCRKAAFGKVKGLIGEKTPEAIVFKTRFGIHTFLLQFPIDVIILDKNARIVAIKRNMKPNRVFFWNIRFDKVIELPVGGLEKSKTQIGDFVEFV